MNPEDVPHRPGPGAGGSTELRPGADAAADVRADTAADVRADTAADVRVERGAEPDASGGTVADRPARTPGRLLSQVELQSGPLWLGVGLVISAVSAYGFLALAGRELGSHRYASLAVMWTMVSIVGIGLFNPIELEMSRAISHRRGLGQGGLPLFVQAFKISSLAMLLCAVVMLAGAPVLLGRLYDGSWLLLLWTLLTIAAMALSFLSRGVLASVGRFTRYGVQLVVEGVLRVGLAVAYLGVGAGSADAFGLILAVALAVAVVVTFTGPRRFLQDGPPVRTAELTRRLALLVGASVLSYTLVNAGPILVKLLAGPGQQRAAGVFLSGLQMARVPLFLFAAISVVMLPRLAASYARGDMTAFRRFLLRVLLLVAAVGAVGVAASAAIGPWAVRVLFGPSFVFGRTDLALLAAGTALYMFGLTLGQALLAVESHAAALWGWVAGAVGLAVATWAIPGLEVRVEWGFVVGSAAAVAAMAALLQLRLRDVTADLAAAVPG